MDPTSLVGKRVLVTHADLFMGPALAEVFREKGADVIADTDPLEAADAAQRAVTAAGDIDVLVVHLAEPAPSTPAGEVSDAEWRTVFQRLVDPLPRLVRAVLPQMKQRGAGKI